MRAVAVAIAVGCSPPAEALFVADQVLPGGGPAVVVVEGGRITAVLPPKDGPRARSVTRCALLTPGVVDAHGHPSGLARARLELDLVGLPTYAATLKAIADAPGDGWLVGRGWDHEDWPDAPDGAWPDAAALDTAARGRPVFLRRVDGHAAWVSSAALATAQLPAEDPPGGQILRDASGAPRGVLIDTAMDLVAPGRPPPDAALASLRVVLANLAAAGLTGVHEMGVDDDTLDLWRAAASDDLPVRVWIYVDPTSRAAEDLMARGPYALGPRVNVVGVKLYADGSLGSRGAWLSLDYADQPGHQGTPILEPDAIRRWAERAAQVGAQVATHAIGDLAVHHTLNAYRDAAAVAPPVRPMRIEHAQIVGPKDRRRFHDEGVIASMQPTHLTSDMPWAPERLGPLRIPWGYAWKPMREAGATLAFGSDFPVEVFDPSVGLGVAVTRVDPASGAAYAPALALSPDEAIAAYTSGAAAALGLPAGALGVLAPGAVADLTCWDAGGGAWPWRVRSTHLGADPSW